MTSEGSLLRLEESGDRGFKRPTSWARMYVVYIIHNVVPHKTTFIAHSTVSKLCASLGAGVVNEIHSIPSCFAVFARRY